MDESLDDMLKDLDIVYESYRQEEEKHICTILLLFLFSIYHEYHDDDLD
tara:strand:- start:248 stop:394 length:147 start_codon:yes stop_codon:yes gene_type:complete